MEPLLSVGDGPLLIHQSQYPPPLQTLQWQLSTDGGANWSNVVGATSDTYNLLDVALANDGRQFRAVATNDSGSVNSNAATLTVNAASSTNAILVSATPSGVVSNAESHTPSISADGQWVAFASNSSAASNLVADGFGGGAFLHDMSTRATTRINVRPDGGYSSQSVVSHLKLAADGQHALFTSYANDLVGGDTNGVLDVFVRNLQTGVTTRENVLPDGSQDSVSGNAGHPFPPDISADGRWVLMWSQVNLAGVGDYVGRGLFLRDRQTGVTRSVVPIGTGPFGASLSASGQYVVSVTTSSAPYTYHLDVYNVAQSTTTRLLSVPYDNGLGAIHGVVSVSDDGRFVACSVLSPTLVGGAAATSYQTVALDRSLADPVAGMELVSVTDAGVAGSGGSSTRPQLSGDGRYVLFASRATNLAVELFADTLLVRDRQAGTTRVASRRIDGTPASGGIGMGSEALTRDGAIMVFMGDIWKIVDPTGNSGTGWQIFRVGRP
jgi:Tol biopolymer transport system component